MAFVTTNKYTLDGTGTEIPAVDLSIDVQQYIIIGTAVATGNYSIVPTGTPYQGSKVIITYGGTLDITTNSKTFSVFGESITQNFLISKFQTECTYNGTAWDVIVKPNLADFSLGSGTIGTNAIATSNIQEGAITHPKLGASSVWTNNVNDYAITQIKHAPNSVGLPQLIVNSVDSTIIVNNSILNSKIPVNTITNDRLVNAPTHSIKIVDGSGLVQDLQLPANQLPMSNGTTIVGIDRGSIVTSITNSQLTPGGANSAKVTNNSGVVSDIVLGTNQVLANLGSGITATSTASIRSGATETVNIPISFESGEQSFSVSPIGYPYYIRQITISVIKNIAGTDDATLNITSKISGSNSFQAITIPASTTNSTQTIVSSTLENASDLYGSYYLLELKGLKTTAGGKILVSLLIERQ